jgi:preprotein translocase subunit SecB
MADAGMTDANSTERPSLGVRAQYIVDFSFENPNAPGSLIPRPESPEVSVGFDVQARAGAENQFEVVLKVGARASQGEETVFAVELLYGGIFEIQGIPDDALQAVVMIECPRLLFPFARSIIANITREGGFPPLMLEPVDFVALYQSQIARAQAEQGANDGTVGHA